MRKKKHPEHVNHERWLVSYADFITLLFAFFVVMFAVSQVDSSKMGRFTESFQSAIGLELTTGGKGLFPEQGGQITSGESDTVDKGTADKKETGTKAVSLAPEQLRAVGAALEDQKRIKKELAGLKIVWRGNELVLRLDETVLFESGDSLLSARARGIMKMVAQELKARPVKIRVEGHTDNRPISSGRYRSNWDLSAARATSVVVELATMGEIDPSRLAAVGYAEFQPLGDNTTPEGRLQNRRVDFVLTIELPQEKEEEAIKPEPSTPAAPTPEPTKAPAEVVPASTPTEKETH